MLCIVRGRTHIMKLCKAEFITVGVVQLRQGVSTHKIRKEWFNGKKKKKAGFDY